MSQKTPAGVQYATPGDAPDMAAISQNLAATLEGKVIPSFATSAARTAAITAPTDGYMTYQQDAKRFERWSAANGVWTQFVAMNATMSRGAVQGVASGGLVGVSWDTTVINFMGIAATPAGVTVPAAGWYRVRFAGEFVANATGRRFACILKNGVEVTSINRFTVAANTAANGTGLILPGMKILCAANDVINVGVFQDSGVQLNLSANATMEVELAQ